MMFRLHDIETSIIDVESVSYLGLSRTAGEYRLTLRWADNQEYQQFIYETSELAEKDIKDIEDLYNL